MDKNVELVSENVVILANQFNLSITIVDKLPHTPFTALGFNFDYFLTTEDSSVEKYTRSLFLKPNSPLSSQFDEDNAKFGGYFSKDVSGFRLKLDIKPISIKSKDKTMDKIQLAFNFHLDLVGNDKAKTILKYLAKWDSMVSITKDIVKLIK
jgi:hypothetical protein